MKHDKIEKDDILEKYGINIDQLKNKNIDKCPPPGQIIRYLSEELSEQAKEDIEEHINFCTLCMVAFERLQQAATIDQKEIVLPENWNELEKTITEDFYHYLEIASVSKEKREITLKTNWLKNLKLKWKNLLNSFFIPSRMAFAGALAAILFFSLYTIAYLSRPDYFNLAQIKPESKPVYRSKETLQNDFQGGLKSFEQQKFERAIIAFESYLEQYPNHYETNYYLGLSYLFQAKKEIPGLPYNFDKKNVEIGMKYLTNALRLSQENQFYQEDCYWFLGKAYLMKGELDKAKEQFEKIIELNQPNLMRKEQARELIQKIADL